MSRQHRDSCIIWLSLPVPKSGGGGGGALYEKCEPSNNCIFSFQTAVITMTHLAMNHMSKEKGGSGGIIVNISSIAGLLFNDTNLFLLSFYIL